MRTANSEVESLLNSLPEDCTLEDSQYHLYILEKVKAGLERAEREGTLTQEGGDGATRRMGLRLAWSPEAADDLNEIVAYIARDSSAYARAVASKMSLDLRRRRGSARSTA